MKETLDLRGLNFEEGYIAVIDKPLSWTSTDVVRKIKSALRRLGYRKIKVGHAGTLGSVVTRDIPAGSFAAGNPARVIRPITAADTVRGRFPGIRGE